jgi:hypothetical protein
MDRRAESADEDLSDEDEGATRGLASQELASESGSTSHTVMPASRKLDELLDGVKKASSRLSVSRGQAHTSAIALIRELEWRLHNSLQNETLRGLPELTPGPTPLQGVQVRSIRYDRQKFEEPLPTDGKSVLVLDKYGALIMARRVFDPIGRYDGWTSWVVADDELKAEDLEPFTRAVQLVMENHLARVERTAQTYDKVSEFANRLSKAIGFRL